MSIARPYALAAFEYARDHQQLAAWKDFLATGAEIARNPLAIKVLANPGMTHIKLDLFESVLGASLDTGRKNFLLMLADNERLIALPDISALFNDYYAALEKISQVTVITAIKAQEEFKCKLAEALEKRIKHEVVLNCEIDPEILGGAIIHIGDRVIDGSVRGTLNRLLEYSLR